jgi:2-oxo-3-(phosphooxy)propyl 3-oxoalkanoate synthase
MTARLQHTGDPVAGQQSRRVDQLTARVAESDTLVTDLQIVGEDNFAVSARWPAQQGLLGNGSYDPMLYAETVRQAALVIARRAFDAPLKEGPLPYQVSWEVNADGLRATGAPVDLMLTATAHDVRRQDGQVERMRLEFDCYRDGYRVGFATQGWSAMSAASYRRARGANPGAEPYRATLLPPVEPGLVGRPHAVDVVIAETSLYNVWALRFDANHPVLFDQTADHVPTTVILEGARQVALRMVDQPDAVALRAEFAFIRCVEFDEPCLIVADEDPPFDGSTRAVSLTFEQNGLAAASAMVAVRVD